MATSSNVFNQTFNIPVIVDRTRNLVDAVRRNCPLKGSKCLPPDQARESIARSEIMRKAYDLHVALDHTLSIHRTSHGIPFHIHRLSRLGRPAECTELNSIWVTYFRSFHKNWDKYFVDPGGYLLPEMAPSDLRQLESAAANLESLIYTQPGSASSKTNIPEPANSDATKTNKVTWQEAAVELHTMWGGGAPFTSQNKLARKLNCSSATINKAIKNTPDLKEWSTRQKSSATGMQRLGGVVEDTEPQQKEVAPDDIVEDGDVDRVMQYLMEQARPAEQARINDMSPADQRQLAETMYRDPDLREQVMRYSEAERRRKY